MGLEKRWYFYTSLLRRDPFFLYFLSKELRDEYFKTDLGNRDATIDDLTKEGLSAFVKFKDDKYKKLADILGLSQMPQKNLEALEEAMEKYTRWIDAQFQNVDQSVDQTQKSNKVNVAKDL